MKVVLHIGSEKTGTSSIQAWCTRNREALKARGILYPRSLGQPNHTKLACYAVRAKPVNDLRKSLRIFAPEAFDRFRAELPGEFRREVEASGCQTLLASNEHCSSRVSTREEIQAIRALIEQACGEVEAWRIILYVRRQDEMLESSYSTTVKSGSVKPFRLPMGTQDPRLNPLPVLDLWAAEFGLAQVSVAVFDRTELHGGDVVADLMARLGIEDAADPKAFAPVPRANLRLSGLAVEFLRRFNAHVPAFDAEGVNPARRNVVRVLESLPDTAPLQLADEAAMTAFCARFDEVNAEIARRYLGRADGQLFRPREAKARQGAPARLDVEAAVRIAAHLWQARVAEKTPERSGKEKPGT
jgi:hypothetical protein